jgi:hypothetical protein
MEDSSQKRPRNAGNRAGQAADLHGSDQSFEGVIGDAASEKVKISIDHKAY